jgi:hypothetical protein
MKPGELVHAEPGGVTAAQKLEVFGPVDSSSFHGLGLAQTLSDHLEGIYGPTVCPEVLRAI